MSAYEDPPQPLISRTSAIAGAVLVMHVLALWGLQSGLLRRAVETIVPVQLITEFIESPRAKEPPPPPVAVPPPSEKAIVAKSPIPAPAPAPQPVAIADPTPAVNAPTGSITPIAVAPINAPVITNAPTAAPPARPAPPHVELPSSDADYLQNPKPPYPRLSKKLNEQGTVIMRVQIGANGEPLKAEIGKSSGYERLDEAAAATVMKWRYLPGKRNGVAEVMWFNVPINFVLE